MTANGSTNLAMAGALMRLASALLASGLMVGNRPATDRHVERSERCTMPAGWLGVARAHPRFVIFGEIHGTREAPAFVGKVACSLANKGDRVLVAIEHSAVNDEAFQAAWRLPDPNFQAAITKVGWAGRRDGVASAAMLDLLLQLHRLKEAGRSVAIVAFNGFRDEDQRRRFAGLPGQGPHEAAQAENIRKAADAGHYDHILVLTGNLHARKKPIEENSWVYRPMAMQLASPGEIVSLNMRTAGGKMWNCIIRPDVQLDRTKPVPDDAIECGDRPTKGWANMKAAPFMALRVKNGGEDDNYDGIFWVGRVSGSGPALAYP
ncbi:hypothetical protein [Sphingomonas aerophila]|uniref:Haem-binding uptake Tiki superfamily ChaN domain-containing protein n=1 Tax=Sphingomonas aerophila TaxID=1344948 RepID=A0A7W9EU23_9SPHN|nr:hypothetical protein [Sphingomonas aerophila]MBB5713212.1 hypothetical protein [Sphingomonas aerophila]